MPKQYIVSPHDDAGNMFSNALGMTVNAWNKGKRRIDPVFKSERQRKAFKRASIQARNTLRANMLAVPWAGGGVDPRVRRLRAIRKLNKLSQPSRALKTLGRDNRTRPKVYVQGHGAPGFLNITDNLGNAKSARQTSTTLKRLGIPERAKVRLNSCWSGTQTNITPVQATTHYGNLNPSMLPHSGPPMTTFAGNVAHNLRNVGRRMPNLEVGGYLGPTSQSPVPTVRSDLVTPSNSMRVRFHAPMGAAGGLGVKRGDAKRMF